MSEIEKKIDEYKVKISDNKQSNIWTYFGKLINKETGKILDADYDFCVLCFNNEPKKIKK